MSIHVEATYENGVLRPALPLPLQERARVRITIEPAGIPLQPDAATIPCTDARLIEWAASDAELDYPSAEEA